jgi:succinate-acetate transporter protein
MSSNHVSNNTPVSHIATPGALGFFAFACTTLVFGLSTVSAGGVHQSNIVLGMAISTGGIAQMLAGMWEVCPFPSLQYDHPPNTHSM